jgi:type I restriction enzyme S subunit
LSEQLAIAAFLDRETAKIDALVEEQRRLIELLKEKRQAVISHAVTKGLDPTVPMKDSGVEWLGEVPAHWEVVPARRLVGKMEQGWSPQCEARPAQAPDEWGVLKVGCVNGGVFAPDENKALPPELDAPAELRIHANDLLVSRANTRELVGSAAVVDRDYPNLLLCDKLYRLTFGDGRCDPRWAGKYMSSRHARGQFELAATGASSSMVNISQAVILDMPLALPPMHEQASILKWLNADLERLAALEYGSLSAIALLQERRAALISAAVTGKIDVRGLVPAEAEAA